MFLILGPHEYHTMFLCISLFSLYPLYHHFFHRWQFKGDSHGTDKIEIFLHLSVTSDAFLTLQIKFSRHQTISFAWIIYYPLLKDHHSNSMIPLLQHPLVAKGYFSLLFEANSEFWNQAGWQTTSLAEALESKALQFTQYANWKSNSFTLR